VSEPPKQNGSYSAQVIVVGHDDSDLRGCGSTADHVARDADQRPGFEGTQCEVLTAPCTVAPSRSVEVNTSSTTLLPVIVGPPGYSACSY
jgi:hypothetical protein